MVIVCFYRHLNMEIQSNNSSFIKRIFLNEKTCNNASFRVLQWNILAQGLTYSTETENFCKVPPQFLEWDHRSKLIMEHIGTLNPHVICLQEVDHFDDFFVPCLIPKGYRGFFAPKLDSPCFNFPNNGPDGVALFYKSERFLLKDLVISYLNDGNGKERKQAILACVLEDIITCQCTIIAVTHLKAKDGFEMQRVAQANDCINVIESMLNKHKNSSVIWCGDFNSEENEECHSRIKKAKINVKNVLNEFSSKMSFTTWKRRPDSEKKQVIDFIFYSSEYFSPENVLLPPDEVDIPTERFPSFNHPSDHISLCVDFSYV
ncbi:nocturnin isoform X2 [Hydra vulgaris]|uniref:Nocturnin n=1 Tax=Hydra vulgaris TaxID=6087 RepID=A0ABM4D2A2_HYDVU